jgi:mRNA interferase MazF
VNPSSYEPKARDLVWVDYDSPVPLEHKERHMALVVSDQRYNVKTGRVIICFVTSNAVGYPFEVVLPMSCNITGVIISDHLRTIDGQTCKFTHAGVIDYSTFNEVTGKLAAVLGI